jgi:hypothetical protein
MKKNTTITTIAVLILAVLFSMLPVSTALAKRAPDAVTITVKNHTSGKVTVTLTDENNARYTFTFEEPGMYDFSIPQGHYSYYATTPCGSESGEFNLNVHKELFLSCQDGREIILSKSDCEVALWVGSAWQWFETNPAWWPTLLGNSSYDAQMKCIDPSFPSVNTPFGPPV